jgi:glyoxalase family protein
VPAERQIAGLGPITLSVPSLERTARVLTEVMNMRAVRTYPARERHGEVHVFEMGPGGPAAELHVIVEPDLPRTRPGAGGVHHVAFRTPDQATLRRWVERVGAFGLRSSGEVERFYFTSLYFREPGGILFEIATDVPGFTADEPLETLGERLSLPPFLEGRRASIEAGLKPLE